MSEVATTVRACARLDWYPALGRSAEGISWNFQRLQGAFTVRSRAAISPSIHFAFGVHFRNKRSWRYGTIHAVNECCNPMDNNRKDHNTTEENNIRRLFSHLPFPKFFRGKEFLKFLCGFWKTIQGQYHMEMRVPTLFRFTGP